MSADPEMQALLSTAGRFLSRSWPLDVARPLGPADDDSVRSSWRGAAQLGWAWVARAERPELALQAAPSLVSLFEVVGRHPSPVPAAALAVALPVLASAAVRPLEDYLDGIRLLAVGAEASWPAGDSWSAARVHDGRMSGSLRWVAAAGVADAVAVPARHENGYGWYLVDTSAPGVTVRRVHAYDRLEASGEVQFDDAPATLLVRQGDADDVLATIAALDRVTGAAELAALASASTSLAVEYAQQRTQFGRSIGSFQAIKHLLADAQIEVYAAESAAISAARDVAILAPPGGRRSAELAFSFAAGAARRAAEIALQVHGGIGFTLEARLSWYFNRIHTRIGALGSPRAAKLDLGRAQLSAAGASR